MRQYDLTDKLVVITGGNGGIGRHAAKAFAEAGAKIVITGRDEPSLRETAVDIGPCCTPIVCDQREPEAVRAMADQVNGELGGADVLIANAGGGWGGGPVMDTSIEQWRQTIDTNLTGTFLVCRALLGPMVERQRGDVILVSSMSGKKGDPGGSAYAASKFGLQGFGQSLNHEVRRHNVRVMILNPSSVNTEPGDTAPPDGPGQTLHAADLATLMVHLVRLPGRTLVRDADIWGTNPF